MDFTDYTDCTNFTDSSKEKNKEKRTVKTALTVAGSDSSGGAGIQADIKTMTANGVYAMSAVTALTAQNTMGVSDILSVPPEFLSRQLDSVFEDIFPDAVKVGMMPSGEHISAAVERFIYYGAKNIVVDPVTVSTSGRHLADGSAVSAMTEMLFPISVLVTPNIPECEMLCGVMIKNADDAERAGRALYEKYKTAFLIKGGHGTGGADDFLIADGLSVWLRAERIENKNTHGTGCTLSSAVSANLAKGFSLYESVKRAKDYITGAISARLDIGCGNGPMYHAFDIGGEFAKYPEEIF